MSPKSPTPLLLRGRPVDVVKLPPLGATMDDCCRISELLLGAAPSGESSAHHRHPDDREPVRAVRLRGLHGEPAQRGRGQHRRRIPSVAASAPSRPRLTVTRLLTAVGARRRLDCYRRRRRRCDDRFTLMRSGTRRRGHFFAPRSASSPRGSLRTASFLMSIGVWTAQVWNECARQMHQVAECVRHSIGDPLLNDRRLNRRQCSRTAGVLRGLGRSLRFFRRRRLSRLSLSLSNWFCWGVSRLLRGFCSEGFTSGFFFESIFGVDGSADSFDTDAVGVAFGFGVSARGAEAVEAGVGGAVAIGAPSGLTVCEAADAAAVFGASARGGAESVEAGVDGAVAIGAPSGLIACEAADGAAVFGASARGGAESGEAGAGRRCCNWRPVRPDRLRGCRRGRRLWRLSQRRR